MSEREVKRSTSSGRGFLQSLFPNKEKSRAASTLSTSAPESLSPDLSSSSPLLSPNNPPLPFLEGSESPPLPRPRSKSRLLKRSDKVGEKDLKDEKPKSKSKVTSSAKSSEIPNPQEERLYTSAPSSPNTVPKSKSAPLLFSESFASHSMRAHTSSEDIQAPLVPSPLASPPITCRPRADSSTSYLTSSSSSQPALTRSSVFFDDSPQPIQNIQHASKQHAEALAHIRDPDGCYYFRQYLRSRHCEELLAFFLEVEKLQVADEFSVDQLCRNIFEDYIQDTGRREINISGSAIKTIREAFATGNLTRSLFDGAQLEALRLMVQNCWTEYKASTDYMEYLMSGTHTDSNLFASDRWEIGEVHAPSVSSPSAVPIYRSKSAQRFSSVLK